MPDETNTTNTTEPNPDQSAGGTPPASFEAWLAAQTDEVRALYTQHVTGLKGALDSEREQRKQAEKAAKERAKAEEDAERKRLAEQGEFKTLAEQAQAKAAELETRVNELTPLGEQLTRYREALEGYAKAAREGVPAHVTELLDRMDPIDQLDYLTKHAAELRKTPGGLPSNPARNANTGLSDEERARRAARVRL